MWKYDIKAQFWHSTSLSTDVLKDLVGSYRLNKKRLNLGIQRCGEIHELTKKCLSRCSICFTLSFSWFRDTSANFTWKIACVAKCLTTLPLWVSLAPSWEIRPLRTPLETSSIMLEQNNAYALRAELNQISRRKDQILYVPELTATGNSDDWKF